MDRREGIANDVLVEWRERMEYIVEAAEYHELDVEQFKAALESGDPQAFELFSEALMDQALEEADERGAALDYKINDDYSHDDRDWN